MPQGTVLWYDPDLGYGFIRPEKPGAGGAKIFVRSTAITGDQALEMGDTVTFSKVEGEQRIEAVGVVKTGSLGASTGNIPKEIRAGLPFCCYDAYALEDCCESGTES
jgi:cold shock CspA family protein